MSQAPLAKKQAKFRAPSWSGERILNLIAHDQTPRQSVGVGGHTAPTTTVELSHNNLRQCTEVWSRYQTTNEVFISVQRIIQMLSDVGVFLSPSELLRLQHRIEVERMPFGLLDYLEVVRENISTQSEIHADRENKENAFNSVMDMVTDCGDPCEQVDFVAKKFENDFGLSAKTVLNESAVANYLQSKSSGDTKQNQVFDFDSFCSNVMQKSGMDCVVELFDLCQRYPEGAPPGVVCSVCLHCGMRRETANEIMNMYSQPNGLIDVQQMVLYLEQVDEEVRTLNTMQLSPKPKPPQKRMSNLVKKMRSSVAPLKALRSSGDSGSSQGGGKIAATSRIMTLVAKFGHIVKTPKRESISAGSKLLARNLSYTHGSLEKNDASMKSDGRNVSFYQSVLTAQSDAQPHTPTKPTPPIKEYVKPSLTIPNDTTTQFRAEPPKGSGSGLSEQPRLSRAKSFIVQAMKIGDALNETHEVIRKNTVFRMSAEEKKKACRFIGKNQNREVCDERLFEFYHGLRVEVGGKSGEGYQHHRANKAAVQPQPTAKELGFLQFGINTGPALTSTRPLSEQPKPPPPKPKHIHPTRPSMSVSAWTFHHLTQNQQDQTQTGAVGNGLKRRGTLRGQEMTINDVGNVFQRLKIHNE